MRHTPGSFDLAEIAIQRLRVRPVAEADLSALLQIHGADVVAADRPGAAWRTPADADVVNHRGWLAAEPR